MEWKRSFVLPFIILSFKLVFYPGVMTQINKEIKCKERKKERKKEGKKEMSKQINKLINK